MDLADFPNLLEKKTEVATQEKEATVDGKKVPQSITTTTTKEIFTNNDKSRKIEKTTIETETSTKLPDGSTEIRKETKVAACEIGRETPESHLEGFKPVGGPKESTTKTTDNVNEGGKTVKRTTTVITTEQEYDDGKGNKKIKVNTKTITEDEQPDGGVSKSVKESIQIMCKVPAK